MNILLVEDNEGDIELTARAFRRGHLSSTLSVAHNGVEAIEYLSKQNRPDLILLDLNMPRMGGLEFLQTMKRDEKLRSIPVIVLTSSSALEDIRECYTQHANCYLLKPFDTGKFVDMVKQIESFWMNLVQLPQRQLAS